MKQSLAMIAVFALAGSVAAVPPPASPPATPERLVEQLGSEVYDEREAAMTALEKLGDAAQAALEPAARSPNPEISKRAARLLAGIRRTADAKDKLTPKPIRLVYRQIPLGTAVNDLKARTGINLTLDPANVADPLRLVTFETGDLPPWEAVEQFCKAAGLKEAFVAELPVPKQEKTRRGYYQPPPPPPLPEAVPVKLVDGKAQTLPGNRSTAVRILALPANFSKHRVYLGSGDVLLHFDVAPMPGFHWQAVSGVRITKVVDDANRLGAGSTSKEPGLSMNEFMDGPVFVGGLGAMAIGWDGDMPNTITSYANPRVVPVPIRVATPTARSLKLLEGAVICEVHVPNQPLATIENIATNPGSGVEGLRGSKLTVLEAKPGKNGGKSILRVQVDMPPPWLSTRFNNPWAAMGIVDSSGPSNPPNQVKGFDAAGKPVRLTVLTSSDSSNDEFTVSTVTQFTCPDGIPTKIVLMGAKPVMVEVPFKMENVPLP